MENNKEFNQVTFIVIFIAIIIPDQISKFFITLTNFSYNNEIFSIFPWEDDQFFLNVVNGLPREVTMVFSLIILIYLFMLLFGLLYFLKNKNLFFVKVGVTGLFLSYISNIIDMTYKASVTLITHFKPLNLSGNFASATKFLFFLLFIYGIFNHWKELIGRESRRKTYLINYPYQLKTSGFFAIALITQGLTFSLFSYFYFSNFTFNFSIGDQTEIAFPYLIGIMVILLLFTAVSFFASIIYTQKTVGPIVAFERFIDDLLAGKDAKLYMRDGDHLTDLKRLAEKLKDGLKDQGPPPLP